MFKIVFNKNYLTLALLIFLIGPKTPAYAVSDYFYKADKNIFLVSDSILSYEQAEELWGTINFSDMQSQVAKTLNLSVADDTLFWRYLQPEIYEDQLAFLNTDYRHVTISGFPSYVDSLRLSYISQYPDFVNNKPVFIEQIAQQIAANSNIQTVNGACTNMGFENGTTSGWTVYSGRACGAANLLPCNLTIGTNSRVTITTAGSTDPFIPSLSTVAPGAPFSLMLEDYLNGANASAISQTFLVTTANNLLTYKYAAVLEDPQGANHTRPQRPYFEVRLSTQSGVDIPCGDYTAVVQPPIANFDSALVDNVFSNSDPARSGNTLDLYYRNWTTVSIPLTKYIGQNITIEFIASDCALGGHRGYAYIWAECGSIPVLATNYICAGQTLSYTAPSGFQAYQWIGPGIVGISNGQTVQLDQPGAYSLVLTPYSDNPCLDTVNFTVLEKCVLTPISDTLCETVKGTGQATGVDLTSFNARITASTSSGTVQGWHSALPANASNLTSSPTNITVDNGSKYFAIITYPSPSTKVDTAELDFVVASLPSITMPSFGPYCAGTAAVPLTGITPAGGVLTGKHVSGGVFNPSEAGDDTITYIYTDVRGCKDTAMEVIVVNAPVTFVAPHDTTACQEQPVTLSTPPVPNATFSWYDTSGTVLSTTNTLNVVAGTHRAKYYVKVTENACSSIDSGQVTGIPSPIVQVNDTSFCVGGSTTLKGNVLNSSAIAPYNPSYSWVKDNTVLLSGQLQLSVNSPGWYYLIVTDRGCKGEDSALVTTNPLPVISLPNQIVYCEDTASSVTLDPGNGGFKYLWQPSKDTTRLLNVSSPGIYTVYVTSKLNCSAQAQVQVVQACPPSLYLSDAFSPNSDGSNDIYDVYTKHVGAYHMLIFNRWGEIIFESQDKTVFWDGIYRSDLMPIGTYPWIITYEGDTELYKGPYKKDGSVTIVK